MEAKMATGAIGANGWHFPIFGAGTTHVIDNPSASTQTPAFAASTRIIRVACTGGHLHVAIGTDPTAAEATSMAMPENHVEYFKVKGGWKLAAIDAHGHGQGEITITEMY